jgi:hypothetical protein
VIEQLAERVIARMGPDERRDLIVTIVERMMANLSAEERRGVMEKVVETFLAGLPDEERRETARELVPRLLAELMKSGGMTVDELLWTAVGSLGALDDLSAGGEPDITREGTEGERK